jgi:hypothetical protein
MCHEVAVGDGLGDRSCNATHLARQGEQRRVEHGLKIWPVSRRVGAVVFEPDDAVAQRRDERLIGVSIAANHGGEHFGVHPRRDLPRKVRRVPRWRPAHVNNETASRGRTRRRAEENAAVCAAASAAGQCSKIRRLSSEPLVDPRDSLGRVDIRARVERARTVLNGRRARRDCDRRPKPRMRAGKSPALQSRLRGENDAPRVRRNVFWQPGADGACPAAQPRRGVRLQRRSNSDRGVRIFRFVDLPQAGVRRRAPRPRRPRLREQGERRSRDAVSRVDRQLRGRVERVSCVRV